MSIASMSFGGASVGISSPRPYCSDFCCHFTMVGRKSALFLQTQPINSLLTIHYHCSFSIHATNYRVINRPPMSFAVSASECTIHSFIFNCFIQARILYWTCVHYIEVFPNIGTRKSVHCSELAGVHYIEVNLQQKLIGGDRNMCSNKRCSLYRDAHYERFYCIILNFHGSTPQLQGRYINSSYKEDFFRITQLSF